MRLLLLLTLQFFLATIAYAEAVRVAAAAVI